MMNRLAIAALCVGLLAACGGKKDAPGKDWSDKALSPVKDKAKEVPFTISLPEGMKLEPHSDELTRSWEPDLDDAFSEPHVAVSYASIPPKSLDQFLEYAMLDDTFTVAKKQELADGYVYVAHTANKGYVKVTRLVRKDDTTLECRASQAKQNGVPNADATMTWLEKICMSLTF